MRSRYYDHIVRSLSAASLLAVLTGCAYQQPRVVTHSQGPQPAERVALITCPEQWRTGKAIIERIDGRTVKNSSFMRGKFENFVYELLPGKHLLQVGMESSGRTSTDSARWSFTAEAGHRYEVRVRSTGTFRWTSWIVDTTMGKNVAGNPPL